MIWMKIFGRLAGLVMFSLNIACTFEVGDDDMAMARIITGWSASADLVTGAGINGKFNRNGPQVKLPEEGSVTTQFNLIGQIANCRAEIISLVNGQSVRRVVTVIDGASITTRGKNISVKIGDFTDASISSGARYSVAALSTMGVRANWKQPPILTPLVYRETPTGSNLAITSTIVTAPGVSRYIPVPTDTGVNSVYVTVIGEDESIPILESELRVNHIVSAISVQQAYDPRNYPDWVPLAANTQFIQLTNRSTTNAAFWGVTFGIDG